MRKSGHEILETETRALNPLYGTQNVRHAHDFLEKRLMPRSSALFLQNILYNSPLEKVLVCY